MGRKMDTETGHDNPVCSECWFVEASPALSRLEEPLGGGVTVWIESASL